MWIQDPSLQNLQTGSKKELFSNGVAALIKKKLLLSYLCNRIRLYSQCRLENIRNEAAVVVLDVVHFFGRLGTTGTSAAAGDRRVVFITPPGRRIQHQRSLGRNRVRLFFGGVSVFSLQLFPTLYGSRRRSTTIISRRRRWRW